MVHARFYLLNRMDLEMEVVTNGLVSHGIPKEQVQATGSCDGSLFMSYQNVPVKTYYNFVRVDGKPAVMGSAIKGTVRRNLRDKADELLGGKYENEPIESFFYFGNFVYSGGEPGKDFTQVYIMNFRNDIYEVALRGAKFSGSIYCKDIKKKEDLARYSNIVLNALKVGKNENFFIGKYSVKGSHNRAVPVTFVLQSSVSQRWIFGGVKFRVIKGCDTK